MGWGFFLAKSKIKSCTCNKKKIKIKKKDRKGRERGSAFIPHPQVYTENRVARSELQKRTLEPKKKILLNPPHESLQSNPDITDMSLRFLSVSVIDTVYLGKNAPKKIRFGENFDFYGSSGKLIPLSVLVLCSFN